MILNTIKLLLPAIVPSWRFFDWIAPSPRVEFKTGDDEWTKFQLRPQSLTPLQSVKRLFWNPIWNDYLFVMSCAERLMQNPTAHSEHQIITHIKKYHDVKQMLQFRLIFITRDNQQETYISDIHHDI